MPHDEQQLPLDDQVEPQQPEAPPAQRPPMADPQLAANIDQILPGYVQAHADAPDDERAIAGRVVATEASLIGALQARELDVESYLQARARGLQAAIKAAVQATAPGQWVLHQGVEASYCVPSATACDQVAVVLAIDVFGWRPWVGDARTGRFEPDVYEHDGQTYMRGWVSARSELLNRRVDHLEFTRSPDERFTGRESKLTDAIRDGERVVTPATYRKHWGDFRSSVFTLGRRKAISTCAGINRVPLDYLEQLAGVDFVAKIPRGHGGGSSADRQNRVELPHGDDVNKNAAWLWSVIVSRVGTDDTGAARQLLKQASAFKDFQGLDDHRRIKSNGMVAGTVKRLQQHATFGGPITDAERAL